jgi:uncharacterized membrane protein YeaQ/YmgE (transglycosylase-associated protein family)
MPVVFLMLIGGAAGYLAARLMGVRADVPTLLFLGVFGALVGGFGLRLLSTSPMWFTTLIAATLGAMLLVWVWRVFFLRR